MGYERIKTEHRGAKNGGGAWMTRLEAKQAAKRKRRQEDGRSTQSTVREGAEHGRGEPRNPPARLVPLAHPQARDSDIWLD